MPTSDAFNFPLTIPEAQALHLAITNQLYFSEWDVNYPPAMEKKRSLEILETKLIDFINSGGANFSHAV